MEEIEAEKSSIEKDAVSVFLLIIIGVPTPNSSYGFAEAVILSVVNQSSGTF